MTDPDKLFHSYHIAGVPDWLADFLGGCGLKFDFRTGPFLAGGSVRRAVQWNLENYTWKPDKPPDYDVFCHSKNQWEQTCDQLLGIGAELTIENDHYANFVVEEKD